MLAVQVGDVSPGLELSAAVEDALPRLVREAARALGCVGAPAPHPDEIRRTSWL